LAYVPTGGALVDKVEGPVKGKQAQARLILEDGAEFLGISCGYEASVAGEVVFTTGMVGYPQSLTDPSYKGQILVSTYPLIGNYGVPGNAVDERGIPLFFESDRVQASAFVVSEYVEEHSHYASAGSLGEWLKKQKIPLISGIDTRALTERLRARGVMRGKILVEGRAEVDLGDGDMTDSVDRVSVKEIKAFKPYEAGSESWARQGCPERTGEGLSICLVDYGVKNNIIRCFLSRGAEVRLLPWNQDLSKLVYDGLFLSNGPGDPKELMPSVLQVRAAMERPEPLCGICMGNHVVGLAAGGDTYKLPYGHRSQNQPCVESGTERCFITSQNHGYAVRSESLPAGWEPWFMNNNDGTVEGIRHKEKNVFSVQFHPEGCPGPRDTEFLFDRFLKAARAHKEGRSFMGAYDSSYSVSARTLGGKR
jgi:carbamoyl-phosphate synthase small subunit